MQVKYLRTAICILFPWLACYASQSAAEAFVQFQYSPIAEVYADEDKFDNQTENIDQYDIEFTSGIGARVLVDIFYLSYRHISTEVIPNEPEATVETLALGLGCLTKHQLANGVNTYTMAGLGAGTGNFVFEQEGIDDWELMLEANIGGGIILGENLTLGIGAEVQHFGSFSESKATTISGYVSAGWMF